MGVRLWGRLSKRRYDKRKTQLGDGSGESEREGMVIENIIHTKLHYVLCLGFYLLIPQLKNKKINGIYIQQCSLEKKILFLFNYLLVSKQ